MALAALTAGVFLACSPAVLDHFFAAKGIAFCVAASAVGLLAALVGEPCLPRISRGPALLLGAALLALVARPALSPTPLPPLLTVGCAVLLAVALCGARQATQGYRLGLFFTLAVTLAEAALQLARLDPFPGLYRGEGVPAPDGFFGNPALAAEFAGLAAIALWRPASRPLLHYGALAGALGFLLLQHSRAGLLALAITFLLFRLSGRRRLVFLPLCLLAVALAGPWGSAEKRFSASARNARWRNTLAMIGERPWGVGAGNFGSAYLEYSRRVQRDPESTEYSLVSEPHSEPLRIAAELGWPFALALAAGLALCLREASPLARESLFFLLATGLVQGTFLHGPSLWAAIALGAGALRPGRRLPRAALLAPAMACLFFSLSFLQAKMLEAHPERESREALARACRAFPSLPYLCDRAAERSYREGAYAEGLALLGPVLKLDPRRLDSLRLRAALAGAAGDRALACASLESYERLFAFETRFSEKFRQLCPDRR